MKRSYSTTGLAKMWGVSESTIKRWADAGVLKCRRTIGGHRKFDHEDVMKFQSRSGLVGAAKATITQMDGDLERLLAESDFHGLSRRYREAVLRADGRLAAMLLNRIHLAGVPLATIGEDIIAQAMREIGDMWREGKLRVFEEHLATFATLQALAELNPANDEKQNAGRLALVGCSDGELHQVASIVVRCMLEAEGWTVFYLGPYTPLFSFADAVSKFNPDLVCISATMADDLERAARDYESLRRAALKLESKIVMGGQAMIEGNVRARFKGASYARNFHDLLEFIESDGLRPPQNKTRHR